MIGMKKVLVMAISGLVITTATLEVSAGQWHDGYWQPHEPRIHRDGDRKSHKKKLYKHERRHHHRPKRHRDIYRYDYRHRYWDYPWWRRHYHRPHRYYDDDDYWLWYGLGVMTPYLLDDRF